MGEGGSENRLSAMARLRRSRKTARAPSRLKNYGLVAAIAIVFSLGVYLAGGGREFLQGIYSHFAILLVVFLIIEYIVLKGRDRSRIYKIERDQARARRREDIEFLREIEERIETVQQDLEGEGDQARERALENLRELRRRLSQRV